MTLPKVDRSRDKICLGWSGMQLASNSFEHLESRLYCIARKTIGLAVVKSGADCSSDVDILWVCLDLIRCQKSHHLSTGSVNLYLPRHGRTARRGAR